MIENADGVIERLFDRLRAGDWSGYGVLLSANVERIGPWGDRVVGRDRLVEMMAMIDPSDPGNDHPVPTWDVHQIAYAPDGRSGFARVTAHPGVGPLSQFEETLAFVMDEQGLVCRIEVFWQTPQYSPPDLGSATMDKS
jgi:hypothetical protein